MSIQRTRLRPLFSSAPTPYLELFYLHLLGDHLPPTTAAIKHLRFAPKILFNSLDFKISEYAIDPTASAACRTLIDRCGKLIKAPNGFKKHLVTHLSSPPPDKIPTDRVHWSDSNGGHFALFTALLPNSNSLAEGFSRTRYCTH